jgi:hypothetical protein
VGLKTQGKKEPKAEFVEIDFGFVLIVELYKYWSFSVAMP